LGEAISYIKANKDLYHKNLSGERGFSDSARDKIIEASNILDNTGVRLMFNYEAADYHMFNIQKYLSKAIEAIAELERDGADNGKH